MNITLDIDNGDVVNLVHKVNMISSLTHLTVSWGPVKDATILIIKGSIDYILNVYPPQNVKVAISMEHNPFHYMSSDG